MGTSHRTCRFAGDQGGAVAVRDAEIKSTGGKKLCDVREGTQPPHPDSVCTQRLDLEQGTP